MGTGPKSAQTKGRDLTAFYVGKILMILLNAMLNFALSATKEAMLQINALKVTSYSAIGV